MFWNCTQISHLACKVLTLTLLQLRLFGVLGNSTQLKEKIRILCDLRIVGRTNLAIQADDKYNPFFTPRDSLNFLFINKPWEHTRTWEDWAYSCRNWWYRWKNIKWANLPSVACQTVPRPHHWQLQNALWQNLSNMLDMMNAKNCRLYTYLHM